MDFLNLTDSQAFGLALFIIAFAFGMVVLSIKELKQRIKSLENAPGIVPENIEEIKKW